MNKNIISLENIAVSFDGEKILNDINLDIKDKEFVTFLGPSGCGKTTTLRIIGGFLKPDSGIVRFDGKEINNIPPYKRNVNTVFQRYALFPHLNVYDNIAFGLKIKKFSDKEIQKRVGAMMELVNLKGFEKRSIDRLSGGQQQRVALARMMIGEPEAILLDEPFSALDGFLKDVLQREMQDFLKDYPGDMILVTHSRDEAYKFCKELSVVDGGRILVTDETKRLFENPRMLKAAKLTGCKNFSAVQRLGEHEIYATDWKMKLHTAEKVAEDITHVGIRGHWIRPEEKPGENCLEVQVDEYIETTFEHQYMIRKKDEEAAAGLWWMRPKNSFMEDPDMGLPKYLYLPPEHLMLLK